MDIIKFGIEKGLYPYMERKKGNRVRYFTEELKQTAEFPPYLMKQLQKEKLGKLLKHCAEQVTAYAFLNTPEILAEIEKDPEKVLKERVPLLGKQQFKADPESYIAQDFPKDKLIKNITGGSTSEPLNFYMSRYQVEHYEAARFRGLSWNGISYGSRSIMVWGNQYELSAQAQKKIALKDQLLKNRRMISCFGLHKDQMGGYVELLNSYKPEFLYGYSGGLAAFAQLLKEYGADKLKIKLKAVLATSETLFDWQRELIKEVFGCPVLAEYGARDAGILAFSCPCGHSHVTAENAYFEILDPVSYEPVAPGTPGILAVTDLNAEAQPRLRWLLGDTLVMEPEERSAELSKECGIPLPILRKVEGREDAILLATDGSLVHGDIISAAARDRIRIRQARFIQHTPMTATLMLSGDVDEALGQEFIDQIKLRLGADMQIELQIVNEIKPLPSGKQRYALREFELKDIRT